MLAACAQGAACLTTSQMCKRVVSVPIILLPGFRVERIKETLSLRTSTDSLMCRFQRDWPLDPTMVVSVASSSVGTLTKAHGIKPWEPHPVPTSHILLPPAPCTLDFPIEGKDSNKVPQITSKGIWFVHVMRQNVTQLVKVICSGLLAHSGQREEARSRRLPEVSLGDSLLSNIGKWRIKAITASLEQGRKPQSLVSTS